MLVLLTRETAVPLFIIQMRKVHVELGLEVVSVVIPEQGRNALLRASHNDALAMTGLTY